MNRLLGIASAMSLVVAGFVGADYMSTSISTDGMLSMATSGNSENGSYVSRYMAVEHSGLARDLEAGDSLNSSLSLQSDWPLLVSEFTSGNIRDTLKPLACVFLTDTKVEESRSMMGMSGILDHGGYSTLRSTGSGFSGETVINGSGMIELESKTHQNSSLKTRSFISGNMTVRDLVKYGGRV